MNDKVKKDEGGYRASTTECPGHSLTVSQEKELLIWVEDIRESLRGTINYCERFQNHLPEKEWNLFNRLQKIIPDPKDL